MSGARPLRALGAGLVLLLACTGAAAAHPLAPSLLELRELEGGAFAVRWKTPRRVPTGVRLAPVVPERCAPVGEADLEADGGAVVARWRVECGAAGLVGGTLRVRGLDASRTSALVRVAFADGRHVRSLLRSDADRFVVPAREARGDVGLRYLALGAGHIASGPDHLLFVLGLLLLVAGRRLFLSITAFTLGHSVTLSLAALELVRVPSGPVELGIAASLLLLAAELARGEGAGEGMLERAPWAITFLFGLLHGLGFAAALREAGLPQQEIPFALFSFNLGIEVGQLAFVACMLLLASALRRLRLPRRERLAAVPAYAMGALAAYWCFARAADLLGG